MRENLLRHEETCVLTYGIEGIALDCAEQGRALSNLLDGMLTTCACAPSQVTLASAAGQADMLSRLRELGFVIEVQSQSQPPVPSLPTWRLAPPATQKLTTSSAINPGVRVLEPQLGVHFARPVHL